MSNDRFFDSLLNKFNDFVNVMKKNNFYKRKCLLIGKKKETVYIVVSGVWDKFEEHNTILSNRKELIEKIVDDTKGLVKIFFPNIYRESCVKYVYMNDAVLFRKIVINNCTGRNVLFENYNSFANDADRKRDFSCTERKLLANFGNSVTELSKFDLIICRYKPCEMCNWAVQSLSNFYYFGEGKIYRIIIPENIFCPNYRLTDEQTLALQLLNSGYSDNKNYLFLGDNYVFAREEI